MYTFVSHGLGRSWGLMAGLSLMLGYILFSVALLGGFANYLQLKLHQYGIGIPWIWLALLGVALVAALAFFEVEISARILGVALISELLIIAATSIGFFATGNNFQIDPILPWTAITNGVAPGVAVFFAFWSWVGFEAAPNYAEESKDPVRTIPIAVLFSCIGLGVLYTVMTWSIATAYPKGTDWSKVANAGSTLDFPGHNAVNVDYDHFVLGPAGALVGPFFADAMSYLIITGSLACAAALGNAGLRYAYAMGREGVLPRWFGKTHPIHKSPTNAIYFAAAASAAIFLLFWVFNHKAIDAYFWLSPQGVIWIILVQALTSLAVFQYFRRQHPAEQSWKTTICGPLAFVLQLGVLALFFHYETFVAAGSSIYVKELFTIGSGAFSVPVSWLGIVGVLVPALGMLYATMVKSSNPTKYAAMGHFVDGGVADDVGSQH